MGKARQRAEQARDELHRRRRLPGLRQGLRTATLWGSGVWLGTFASLGVASELAIDGSPGTLLAVLCAGVAAPAVPSGMWAWRARRRHTGERRAQVLARQARQERVELPRDISVDWGRLRRAQGLVEDLALQGLVDPAAITEQGRMVAELYALLVADRRAAEVGAPPTEALRVQVADLAELLVALAAEAVEVGAQAVDASGAPATLRDAHERLVVLRSARAEVRQAEFGGGAADGTPDPGTPRPMEG